MKQRELRRSVFVGARMRLGASWGDVNILNISSRGLMLHARQVPPRGSFLELRRGRHVIVAQVMWSNDCRFGVRTQDALSVDAILKEPDRSAPAARQPQDDAAPVERRIRREGVRLERHEQSRMAGRAVEFACLGIACASAALIAYSAVVDSLGRPLSDVTAALKVK